jgi:hypothetical protein
MAALGPLQIERGSWAEYLVRSRGEQDIRVRFSLLPEPLDDGRAWLEVATVGEGSLPFAAQLLVRTTGGVERARVYALGQAPFELFEGGTAPKEKKAPPAQVEPAGQALIRVAAGAFTVDELLVTARGETTRVSRAARVPLWGLVRAQGPRQTVELLDYGHQGAKTVFPSPPEPRDQGNGSEMAK